MRFERLLLACALTFNPVPATRAADPFAENIRSTDPLAPAQEQQSFHLPAGFSVQCFSAEPDIAKPMNLAFDSRGRLWVTVTREYPFPVPAGRVGRDEIRILEDLNSDGRADKVSVFADGLNIPIGLYPYKDGCVVWSIPNLWWLRDTDGDGRADRREVLYGPLGWERDTHGNNSSFTRGFDGWLYATHGYNNETRLRGRDGHEVHMQSGNTYRIRLDGSRVEQHTWGQVNPFGLCFDSKGNLFSADCHSEPVFQLLPGGYYPSFGKPHDGLGFAPSMIFHDHGSTAISGIWYYEGDDWPEEFQDNVFTGNVMTSRVNRDRISFSGSTPLANAQPDFVISDDPWFRPVCIQLGPDGALYIADFYNRIIGHYEVPLDHPGRDRERGRIWRIAGPKVAAATPSPSAGGSGTVPARFDVSAADAEGLIRELASSNFTRRRLATDELTDRVGPQAQDPLRKFLETPGEQAPPRQIAHALWALHRLGGLNIDLLRRFASHASPLVRGHAQRIAASWPEVPAPQSLDPASPRPNLPGWNPEALAALAREHLADRDPFVQRAAAEAVAHHPNAANIRGLLDLLQRTPQQDTHLRHQARIALRNQIQLPGALTGFRGPGISAPDARALADAALGATTSEAGAFVLAHVQRFEEPRERLADFLRHAARHAPESDLDGLAQFARNRFAEDPGFQLTLFKSVQEGATQRGKALTPPLLAWGRDLAGMLLASVDADSMTWSNEAVPGASDPTNPWFLQQRPSADGVQASAFICSLPPGGERLTGVLRSRPFTLPQKLSFFVAGHDGYPGTPAKQLNKVVLRDAGSREVLVETAAPRNDLAQAVQWNLTSFTGRTGVLEVVDGDTGDAYAWIAMGRLEPQVAPLPAVDPSQIPQRQAAAAELTASLGIAEKRGALLRLLAHPHVEPTARAAAGKALLTLEAEARLEALVPLLAEATVPPGLRDRTVEALMKRDAAATTNAIVEAFRSVPRRLQVILARNLSSSVPGAELLLSLSENHLAPASLLTERSVKDRLAQGKPESITRRAATLTQGVSPASESIQKLIDEHRATFLASKPSVATGNELFTKNCRPCHQIDGQGAVVGPQLDGIGGRGLERLLEDVLDPNRNVDRAFRNTVITLKDGDIVSGLFRREEGETLVLADSTGKDVVVPKNQVHERRESDTSLMPENFGEVIPAEDFNHLLAYLLSRAVGGPATRSTP
jgi:putative heme-binding domain-containing protein